MRSGAIVRQPTYSVRGEGVLSVGDSPPLYGTASHLWLLLDDVERLAAYRFCRCHDDHVYILERSLRTGAIWLRCYSCDETRIIREGVKTDD